MIAVELSNHRERESDSPDSHHRGMARLVTAVQELSLARDLETIMRIVRRAARELTGADGATFVLREGNFCHYADEDAITPLWKGNRFPMSACISGWAMMNRQPAVIEDIYSDARIPIDAYRPTFVKSLAMVPIRTADPIGAIGNYWARRRQPTSQEVELLQALANTTAVAMENVRVYEELEQRVKDRTAQLEAANHELEAFSYAVSHDLRAPLRAMGGYTSLVSEEYADKLDDNGREYLQKLRSCTERMETLIEDLLRLSRITRAELRRGNVDLSAMAREIVARLKSESPDRDVDVQIEEGLHAKGDIGLLRVVLENFLSNAWKYTSHSQKARVEFVSCQTPEGRAFCVRDNGAGFDMKNAPRLFKPFQRLHTESQFPGTGIGLATVYRIIQRHGGRVWVEAATGQGASFYFTLP